MDRERRCEILAAADAKRVEVLADEVLADPNLDLDLELVRTPTTGLVMVRARESAAGQIFNLGEALVTTAHVRLGPAFGYAMILGRNQRHALAAAVLDAALEASVTQSEAIEYMLAEAAAEQNRRDAARWAAVETTAVRIEEL
ncbi:MAG: phosphonate C-P lyase system protein PhnG [Chloroflexi bacterium]|nr:phosphonate C-P lyase system protein PhnG [Chloroflexota bacterium]